MTGNESAAELALGEGETALELRALRASWALGREQRQRSTAAALAAGEQPLAISPVLAIERRPADAYLIGIAGVLDAFNAPELAERLNDLIDGGARRVAVDLRDTTLLDSSGLGALLGVSIRLRERNGELVLLAGPRSVMQGFRLTGLDAVFRIFASEAEALAALASVRADAAESE
jgi:anti-sigma B factor antagonist